MTNAILPGAQAANVGILLGQPSDVSELNRASGVNFDAPARAIFAMGNTSTKACLLAQAHGARAAA
jgi:hypothetical protein